MEKKKQLTCGADQTWEGKPFCKIVTCDFPENPKNGWYVIKDHNGTITFYTKGQSNYNDTIHVACREGHRFNSTSKIRKCLETKKWSGESGQCVLVTCKKLEKLEGGFYNYTNTALSDRFPYNTVVTLHCNQPFKLSNNQNRIRRCTEEGNWDSEPASCIQTQAQFVEGSNAAVISGASASAVVLISVAVVIFFLYRRKRCQQRNEREPNVYTDLSCERRTSESEYSNTYELQLPNGLNSTERASSHEAEICSATEKEGPFYCNVALR